MSTRRNRVENASGSQSMRRNMGVLQTTVAEIVTVKEHQRKDQQEKI